MTKPIRSVPTPLTNRARAECGKMTSDKHWYGYMCAHAEMLERRLIAANKRVKRLKDQRDELQQYLDSCSTDELSQMAPHEDYR